jgi:hypothetical protein
VDTQGKNKASFSEVAVDTSGIDLAWRAHFNYDGAAEETVDTDGDGFSDAEEARLWTNPLEKDELDTTQSPDQRRLSAMEQHRTAAPMINGRAASPAEVMAKEEREGMELSRSLRTAGNLAQARAEKWSLRTGQPLYQGGKGQPHMVVADVEGDRPVFQAEYGSVSNDFAVIPPLWPGGAVGSNVTGYVGLLNGVTERKICGMWELFGSPGNRVVFRGWKRLEENAELKV